MFKLYSFDEEKLNELFEFENLEYPNSNLKFRALFSKSPPYFMIADNDDKC